MDPVVEKVIPQLLDRCSAFMEADRACETPPPFFHLTEPAVLLKVAETSRLWACEASTMNDAAEIQYGRSLAESYLRSLPAPTRYENILAGLIRDPSRAGHPPARIRHFVSSFCVELGRASTWLNYGRSGTGLAIGFDIGRAPSGFWLFPVDYNLASQIGRIKALIEIGRKQLEEMGESAEGARITLVAHIIQMWLTALAVRLKHPAFSDEGEWRLVHEELTINELPPEFYLKKHLRFTASGRTVPYIEVPLSADSIRKVVLGYSSLAHEDHLREALPNHLQSVEIERSTVTVRPT